MFLLPWVNGQTDRDEQTQQHNNKKPHLPNKKWQKSNQPNKKQKNPSSPHMPPASGQTSTPEIEQAESCFIKI